MSPMCMALKIVWLLPVFNGVKTFVSSLTFIALAKLNSVKKAVCVLNKNQSTGHKNSCFLPLKIIITENKN